MGSQHFSRWQLRLLLVGLMTLIGFGALAGFAAAQDEIDEPSSVTTWVRTCLEPGCTELVELTEPMDGVPVDVADAATGDSLGTCITGELEPGACTVEVAGVTSVTVTVDESVLPTGYTIEGNGATLDLEPGVGAEMPFLLFPVDGFPEEPGEDDGLATPVVPDEGTDDDVAEEDSTISGLPETGTGTSIGGSGWDVSMLSASVAVTIAIGVIGFGARTLMSQRR